MSQSQRRSLSQARLHDRALLARVQPIHGHMARYKGLRKTPSISAASRQSPISKEVARQPMAA